MLLPTAAAKLVLTGKRQQVLLPDKLHADCAVMGGMCHNLRAQTKHKFTLERLRPGLHGDFWS